MGRMAQIVNVFARHGLWSLAERAGVEHWLTPEQVKEAQALAPGDEPLDLGDVSTVRGVPARLRRCFEELGPAFVKLGQVLAVREDLLPKEYTSELAQLHTKVQALPYATIQSILTAELGAEGLKQFHTISEKPLAAGSIGQVHEARLASGRRVVIKVQRPGIEQIIKVDLSLMRELASLVERVLPEVRSARPTAMVEEFSRALLSELDFVREAGNITKVRRNFANHDEIVLPEVIWKLTTAKVITQSYLEGIPAWDRERMIASGISPSLLVEHGIAMFLKMVFIDGLFHGDLHPGNLLAMPENRVGVLDLGLCVHLGKSTREHLAGLLAALVDENYNRVIMHYCELATPEASFDADAFEHEVGNALTPFVGLPLADIKSARLIWDLAKVAARHGAPLPLELVVFAKTLASFEGIGLHLDPGFDVLKAAQKFSVQIAREVFSTRNIKQQALIIARDLGQLARHAPLQIRRLLRTALDGDLSFNIKSEDTARLATTIDRASARLGIAMIIAALILGASLLTFAKIQSDTQGLPVYGLLGFALAALLSVYLFISIMRGGRL